MTTNPPLNIFSLLAEGLNFPSPTFRFPLAIGAFPQIVNSFSSSGYKLFSFIQSLVKIIIMNRESKWWFLTINPFLFPNEKTILFIRNVHRWALQKRPWNARITKCMVGPLFRELQRCLILIFLYLVKIYIIIRFLKCTKILRGLT